MSQRPRFPRPLLQPLADALAAAAGAGLLVALAGVALAPGRAAAGEAILYRTADGQQGIVSDPAEVPAGATIVTERKRAVVRLPAAEIERSILGAKGQEAATDPRAAAAAPLRPRAAGRGDDGGWDTSVPAAPPGPTSATTAEPTPGATPEDAIPLDRSTRPLDSVSEPLDAVSGNPSPDRYDAADDALDDDAFEPDDEDLEPIDAGRIARGDPSSAPENAGAIAVPSLSPEERRAAEIAHRERCEKLGLFGYACTPEAMTEAERWGALARTAREKRELGEARVAHLRERYTLCASARQSAICPKRELEAAERRLAVLERREEQIEDACRVAGCLPGWLRL